MKRLLPHQKDAYSYARDRDNVALFMEPRTGKTLPAIRWAQRKAGPDGMALVVAPLSVLRNWRRELADDGINAEILEGSSQAKIDHLLCAGAKWYLVNPAGVGYAPLIAAAPWSVVVVDESTGIRNPRAKITKLFLKAFRHVPHKAVLTGLANPEGPEDYVTQMIFAFGEFMGYSDFWKWRRRWMKPAAFGWEVPDEYRPAIRDAVREDAFLLTAAAAGCFQEKVFETRYVEAPSVIQGLYQQVEKEWAAGGAETRYSVKKETWLAQLAAGVIPEDFETGPLYFAHKAIEAAHFVRNELGGQQAIIWSRFTPEAEGVARIFNTSKIRTGLIIGKTKPADREAIRDRFLAGKLDAVVCQPKVAAMGLDFSSASVAIFTSNYWDLETRAQCLERTNHPLKDRTKPTLVIDMVTPETVDEDVAEALASKWKSTRYFLRHIRAKRANKWRNL